MLIELRKAYDSVDIEKALGIIQKRCRTSEEYTIVIRIKEIHLH